MSKRVTRNGISAFVIVVMVASVFALPVFSDNYKVDAAAKKVKVTFNATGGKIGKANTKKVYVKKGKKVGKLPVAKRTGYTYKGWYTSKSYKKSVTTKTKIKKNMKVYAKWAAKSYNVTYDPQNGTEITTKSVKFNSSHDTPSLVGHKFLGWYDGYGKKYTKHEITKSIKLTAQWSESHPLAIDHKMLNRLGKSPAAIKLDVPSLDFDCYLDGYGINRYFAFDYQNEWAATYNFKNGICRYIDTYKPGFYPNDTGEDHHIDEYKKLYGNGKILSDDLSGADGKMSAIEFMIGTKKLVILYYNDTNMTPAYLYGGYITDLDSMEAFNILCFT